MKILCIGEALVDLICTDKGSPLADGLHFLKKPGGAPTNVAAAIAALGGEVLLAARVGNDAFGKYLVGVMHDFGVSTTLVSYDEHQFTTLAFVSLMENGERDFVFNRGADGFLSKEDIKDIDLSALSIVHFGSATAFLPGLLRESYFHLLDQSVEKGIFTSFDPNYRALLFPDGPQEFISRSWEFLGKTDFFKLSEGEALLLTATATISEAVNQLMQRTVSVFCITLGKEGSLLRLGERVERIAGIPVNAVDTTGAGDAFTGAVLFQLQQHTASPITQISYIGWRNIVANANKAGARTCEHLGAMEGFKQLNDGIFG